jgi:Tol biopolymer transport system component
MYRSLAVALTFVGLLTFVPPTPAQDDDRLKPTNLAKLNTAADEVDPFPTRDGKFLLYASNAEGTFDILFASRSGNDWVTGKPFALNTKEADERSPFLYKNGTVLYFATNAVPDPKLKALKNYDLKMKEGTRAPLPLHGISTRADELHPWVTADGREFYFSRRTDEGWKLLVAEGPNPGPIKGGNEVGFPADFHHASLTSNGLTMYLEGPLDDGRIGLFTSQRAKVGAAWSKPAPLTALNHPGAKKGDMCPSLSADDKMLYFASDRPGGKGGMDLWVIPTAQLKAK